MNCVLLIGLFVGQVASSQPAVEPALAADPEVTRILDALGAGESALLPAVRTAGDINDVARRWGLDKTGPGGRDYCIKMVWMPDRRRAIFCGANHGVPHRLNDVWEYDLPSNTWVCLYGPDASKVNEPANWEDAIVDENKVFRTKRGGPASVGHTWWQITYDPDKRALLWLCSWGIDPAFSKKLREDLGARKLEPPLWLFYPHQRRWEPVIDSKFEGAKPAYQNASMLEYVPELRGSLWTRTWTPGMSLYDARCNVWKEIKPNGGDAQLFRQNAPAPEQVAAYVPGRKLLVAQSTVRQPGQTSWRQGHGRTCYYDIEKNEWKKMGEGPDVPLGHDAGTPFGYDSTAGVCLLNGPDQQMWALDIDKAQWSKITVKGPLPPDAGRAIGYYDPARNVFVVLRGARPWVYRHRQAAPTSGPAS